MINTSAFTVIVTKRSKSWLSESLFEIKLLWEKYYLAYQYSVEYMYMYMHVLTDTIQKILILF